MFFFVDVVVLNDVVSCKFQAVCVSSQQLKSDMSVVYLLLGGSKDDIIKGIITPDGFHVFGIYEFLQIVLIGKKSRKYVQNLWKDICRQNAQFMYVEGTLALAVPSSKMRKTDPKKGATAGTTVEGLKGILDVLGNHLVDPDYRKVVEDIFARYMAGDRSNIVAVNLNDKEHPQIPPDTYNFEPPTASMLIEEAGEPESSRESSMSIEFDFGSTEDHVFRTRV